MRSKSAWNLGGCVLPPLDVLRLPLVSRLFALVFSFVRLISVLGSSAEQLSVQIEQWVGSSGHRGARTPSYVLRLLLCAQQLTHAPRCFRI